MRHQARELALQILFQKEFSLGIGQDLNWREALALYDSSFPSETLKYAEKLIAGVAQNQATLDRLIEAQARHWTLKRMALVDLNVLRLSAFEMLFSDEILNPKIAINEAVELAKKYGTTDSGSFVNGILDAMVEKSK
ncbi:MAG: transcription antitermination factor NusB [Bdellovibrio sp.]